MDTISLIKLIFYADYYKLSIDYLFALKKNNYIREIVINEKRSLTQEQASPLINISQVHI